MDALDPRAETDLMESIIQLLGKQLERARDHFPGLVERRFGEDGARALFALCGVPYVDGDEHECAGIGAF